MSVKDKWSDEFVRHLIAKGSLIPPPHHQRGMAPWHFSLAVAAIIGGIMAALLYGMYAR